MKNPEVRSCDESGARKLFDNARGYLLLIDGWVSSIPSGVSLHSQRGRDILYAEIARWANTAFASELFLKTVLAIRVQQYPSGHNLGILFQEVPEPDRSGICDKWNQHIKKSNGLPSGFNIPITLPELLEQTGDIYIKLRYYHEGHECPPFRIHPLPRIMHDYVCSLRPDWLSQDC
jgi:hypothetical protein